VLLAPERPTCFNPRAREGRDSAQSTKPPATLCFNPRAREGRDHRVPDRYRAPSDVSIHAPGKGATTVAIDLAAHLIGFNPRAREGRDNGWLAVLSVIGWFQSTRPGRARRLADRIRRIETVVSIHAPGKGATGKRPIPLRFTGVSIHAPGKGATVENHQVSGEELVSIHAPGKGATVRVHLVGAEVVVSIHAPGKGATGYTGCAASRHSRFNPRAREGRDIPRSGVTLRSSSFNPRAREGRDVVTHCFRERVQQVSIHAPGKGATATRRPVVEVTPCFNPRAREGRDLSG